MRNIILIAMTALLLGASGAIAQSRNGTHSPSAAPETRSIPPAPVGHRQPRAADVPAIPDKSQTESAEDKALDRKIKSICRGC